MPGAGVALPCRRIATHAAPLALPKRQGPKKLLDLNRPEAAKLGVALQARPAAPLLSPNVDAKLLGLTGAGIKQWIRTGKLPAI